MEKRPTTCPDAHREHHLQVTQSNSAHHWFYTGCRAEFGSVSPAAALTHGRSPHRGLRDNRNQPFLARRDRAATSPFSTTSQGHTQACPEHEHAARGA